MPTFQTVRKAFEDVDFFAKQIGQPPELVERFKTIWTCLTCGLPISPKRFGKFGKETKRKFNLEYLNIHCESN